MMIRIVRYQTKLFPPIKYNYLFKDPYHSWYYVIKEDIKHLIEPSGFADVFYLHKKLADTLELKQVELPSTWKLQGPLIAKEAKKRYKPFIERYE